MFFWSHIKVQKTKGTEEKNRVMVKRLVMAHLHIDHSRIKTLIKIKICDTYLTLKEAGGVQNDPMGFRLAAISHRIMLWSQKFLTLSLKILGRR